jgi:hypothetical protein
MITLRLIARQERLLQELMREIVRMTAQKQPLQVGVPLYPFSHKTLFSRDKAPVLSDESSGTAPLPVNPSYDEQELLSHRSSRNSNSPNEPVVKPSWSQRDVSGSPGNFVQ